MLHHIVAIQVPDPLQAEEVVRRLQALPGLIPEIITYEVGVDVVGGATSYQLGLHSTFADVEALDAYRVHHAHQAVVRLIEEVGTGRVAVDWLD